MKCPNCGGNIPADAADPTSNPAFPFCSKRCKMVDLGHWFAEDYKVTRPVDPTDLPDAPPVD